MGHPRLSLAPPATSQSSLTLSLTDSHGTLVIVRYVDGRGGAHTGADFNRSMVERFLLEFAHDYGDNSLTPRAQVGDGLSKQMAASEIHLDPVSWGEDDGYLDFKAWWDNYHIIGVPPKPALLGEVLAERFCTDNVFGNPVVVIREVKRNHGTCRWCAQAKAWEPTPVLSCARFMLCEIQRNQPCAHLVRRCATVPRRLSRKGGTENMQCSKALLAWHRLDHGLARKKYVDTSHSVRHDCTNDASFSVDGAERTKFAAPHVGGRGGIKGLGSNDKVSPYVEAVIRHSTGTTKLTIGDPTIEGSANLALTLLVDSILDELRARGATKFETLSIQVDGAGNMVGRSHPSPHPLHPRNARPAEPGVPGPVLSCGCSRSLTIDPRVT
jgi:hypothetical protein